MATASAAQAWTPSRVRRSVEANPQAPLSDHADADAERFGFGQRADLAIFGGDVAMANVHHAHVGVGGAAALGGLDRPIGQIVRPVDHLERLAAPNSRNDLKDARQAIATDRWRGVIPGCLLCRVMGDSDWRVLRFPLNSAPWNQRPFETTSPRPFDIGSPGVSCTDGVLMLIVPLGLLCAGLSASKQDLKLDEMLVIFLLAVLANVAYCAVYVADVFAQWSGFRELWRQYRWVLFSTGLIFAGIITRFFAIGFFSVSRH